MATVTFGQTGFDTNNFWVANPSASQNETLENVQSDTGSGLPLPFTTETVTFADLTFNSNGLDYTYSGLWVLTLDRGLLLGTASLTGNYNTIKVESGGALVANYTGQSFNVDLGSITNIPLVDLVLNVVGTLIGGLFDPALPSANAANLYLDATPNLPSLGFTGNDAFTGGIGNDVMRGSAGSDYMVGNAGDDVLNGGAGADNMVGGTGNDSYFVDNINDTVSEYSGGGNADRIFSSIDYALKDNVDVEIISTADHQGLDPLRLTGNSLSNTIYGNAGANILNGGGGTAADTLAGFGGNDSFLVNHAGDRIVEGVNEGASDRVFASVSYTLNAGAAVEIVTTNNNFGLGAINLTGNEFGQAIYGNAGANILNGGGGTAADTLVGFGGNDFYYINHAGDRVVENANEGTNDRIFASVSYAVNAGAAVEIVSTDNHVGTAAINLTGNELAQAIFGNAGSNTINGGLGNDTLSGFGGNDTFLFNTALSANNVDRIADFDVATDTIQLENAIFAGLSNGDLSAGAFNTGTSASQADDRIIFDTATGRLFFDQDGLGGSAAQHFATLTNPVGTISAADFMIV